MLRQIQRLGPFINRTRCQDILGPFPYFVFSPLLAAASFHSKRISTRSSTATCTHDQPVTSTWFTFFRIETRTNNSQGEAFSGQPPTIPAIFIVWNYIIKDSPPSGSDTPWICACVLFLFSSVLFSDLHCKVCMCS